ncbi:MAG TPA: polysaccharide deacetylase family protein [Bacillota bacterium]|nr:polysaccharide deacetylase family protein [Bacillota bacterium]
MRAGWFLGGAALAAFAAYTAAAQARGRWWDPAVLRRGPGQQPRIALTFDDGPHPALTPATLDILRNSRCPAAFFCIGERVKAHPDLVRRARDEGHLVGNHTLSHRHAWLLSPGATQREVAGGAEALAAALGQHAQWMRPPWGAFNAATYGAARSVRQRIALWSVAAPDWAPDARAGNILASVLAAAHPGAIVDLHDGGRNAAASAEMVAALPALIAGLRARGYELVRLDQMDQQGVARF